MSRRPPIENLDQPNTANQLFQVAQRLASVEGLIASVASAQAIQTAAVSEIRTLIGGNVIAPPSAENTLASSAAIAGQVAGVSTIFSGLYSRLDSLATRSQAQADRRANLDSRIAALEAN